MARVTRMRTTRSAGKRSMKKRRPTTVIRRGGIGVYKSTNFLALRNAVRAPRLPRTLGSLFPNNGKFIRHKYAGMVKLATPGVANTIQTWVFRCNSLFDPDYTGTGHQPMYYDEMAAHYDKYTVLWSSIKFSLPPENSQQRIWGVEVTDNVGEIGAASNIESTLEQYSHTNGLKLDKRNNPLVLKKYFSAGKEFKTSKKGILADDQQAVSAGSNPPTAVQRYYILWCAPINSTDILSDIWVQVEMVSGAQWRYAKPSTGS